MIILLLCSCSTINPDMSGKEVSDITILNSAGEYDISYEMYYEFEDGSFAYSPSSFPEKRVVKTYPIEIEFIGDFVNCKIPIYNYSTKLIDYKYLMVSRDNIIIYYRPVKS